MSEYTVGNPEKWHALHCDLFKKQPKGFQTIYTFLK